MTLFGHRVPMFASLLVWCVVWEIVGRTGAIFLLPPMTAILATMGELMFTQGWIDAAWTTGRSLVLGVGLAILLGVPLGVLMGRVKTADHVLGMWVNMFVSAPLSALVPILMILFGLGEVTVVVTVFLFAVWIIVLDTRAGVQHVPPSLVEMGRSYGATPTQLYGRIILWAALPEILAGIRLGVVRGVKGAVVGQLLVSIVGFGELFELYSRGFEMESFWALTILVFAAAMLLSRGIESIEKKVEFYAGVR
jgi:NitT/TauT family transport system permease protein